jgi:hypothetical protein
VIFDPTPASGLEAKAPTSGIWATLRDLIEATSERWDKHVVNYDLDQQYNLFKSVNGHKLENGNEPGIQGWKLAVIGGGVFTMSVLLYVYLRRRRLFAKPQARAQKGKKSGLIATVLYENLEHAMGLQGIHRPPGTPPLKHAEALEQASHPLAPNIMAVTKDYLGARFGGLELDDSRVNELSSQIRFVKNANLKEIAREKDLPSKTT